MSERMIPESAVRELEAIREQAYSAESSDEAALIMAGGIDALLATAAQQDELDAAARLISVADVSAGLRRLAEPEGLAIMNGDELIHAEGYAYEAPAPEEGEALALEVRELVRRYAEHLPSGFRASLGFLLSERGKPAPEPEGLRSAALSMRACADGEDALAAQLVERAQIMRAAADDIDAALARPAAAEGVGSRLESLRNLPNEVPTNWLDPLLTGPEAALPSDLAKCTPRHIEALLRGIQDRQRAVVRAALTSDDGEQADG